MSDVEVVEIEAMTEETAARMAPIWEAAYAALRADVGTLVDLAEMARKAAAAIERRGGRRNIVIRVVPRVRETPVVKVRRSTAKTARRSGLARTWTQRLTRTDEQRARATALRAAQRAQMSDAEREARNRLLTERRHAAEAAPSADALQAKRAARREADRARIEALSAQEREARREAERARSAARHAALTPEQVAARKARQAENYQRRKGTAK